MFFVNGEAIINSIPITMPNTPTGGMINNQMLMPSNTNPIKKKKHPPRDSTLFEPHLGQGSQISFLAM